MLSCHGRVLVVIPSVRTVIGHTTVPVVCVPLLGHTLLSVRSSVFGSYSSHSFGCVLERLASFAVLGDSGPGG